MRPSLRQRSARQQQVGDSWLEGQHEAGMCQSGSVGRFSELQTLSRTMRPTVVKTVYVCCVTVHAALRLSQAQ